MEQSPSALKEWLDSDFFRCGAFLTSEDTKYITLAKGGNYSIVERFYDTSNHVFYLKDFFKNQYLAYVPDSILRISMDEVRNVFYELADKHPPVVPVDNDDNLYEKDYQALKSSLGENLQKVVLISRETYQGFEDEKSLKHLLSRAFEFGAGRPYGLWNKDYGVVGSTPELLYSVKGSNLETFALAGTGRKGEELKLLSSQKDRNEHNLVIQDIKEKLSSYTSDLSVFETEVSSYNSMIHLKTAIVGKVSPETDLTMLTNTLSPTAALGGYPRESSLNFLQESKYALKYGNRYFGSAFGLMSGEEKSFVVSIRNVQWENGRLFIESGGGVIAESDFSKELEEIHFKRDTIRKHYL